MEPPGGTDNVNSTSESRTEAAPPSFRRHRTPSAAQGLLLTSAAAQLVLSLLVTIYLARVLTPAAFGFFSLVATVLILSRRILDLGLGNVAARDIAREPVRERPILEGMMAYRRAAGVAIAAGIAVFVFTRGDDTERWVLLGTAAVLLFTEPAALDPVFQVRQAQGGPALLTILGGLLVLAGSVLLQQTHVAGAAFGWLLVVREALILLLTKLLAERLLGYHPRAGFRGRELQAFFAPALIFGVASLVYTIYFHADVFFVLALRGKDELGAYAAAFRPINPLLGLPWLLMVPLIPVLSATAATDMAAFVRQVRGTCVLALSMGACAAVAGALLAPDLVQLLYQGRYLDGPLSCVNAFRWLAIGLGEVSITTVLTASLLALRRERLLLGIGTAALLANGVANLLLLRHHNFTAAGFATAVTELLFLLCALVGFYVVAGCSPLTWNAFRFATPAVAMALVLYLLRAGAGARVSVGIALGVVAVVALLSTANARRLRAEIAAGPISGLE